MAKKSYLAGHKRYRGTRRLIWLSAALLVVILVSLVWVRHAYYGDLKPVSNNPETQIFVVEKGESVKKIATHLQSAHLIRSAWAFELYVHSKELSDKLQAGTYALSPSETTGEIVTTMTKGRVSRDLVTILPGRRIDQVEADLINDGFKPEDVKEALKPSNYADLPVLAFKPANVTTLEGLLWPDSFQKDSTTSPQVIIRESLMAMGQHLTPDVQAAFANEGLTTYRGLILASLLIREVGKPADQSQAAQVFLSRLKLGMTLDSDATAAYGAIIANRVPNNSYDSPYNTYLHTDLPPTPISTINTSSLAAATHPATTSWLFFVSGDDGTTYFSATGAEHQAQVDKYCHKLCSQ